MVFLNQNKKKVLSCSELAAKCHIDSKKVEPEPTGRSVDELMEHLNTIKKYI